MCAKYFGWPKPTKQKQKVQLKLPERKIRPTRKWNPIPGGIFRNEEESVRLY